MTYSKSRLRPIGIAIVAALSLLALAASSAQASGDWKISGVNTAVTEKVVAEVDPGTHLKLKTMIGTMGFDILCKKLTVDDGLLFVGGGALAVLLFEECEGILLNAKEEEEKTKACNTAATIEVKVKALLIKDATDSKTYVLFSPDNATLTFATIGLGAECAFGEAFAITGHAVAECTEASKCETESVTHLIKQAAAALFTDALLFGTKAARLEGASVVKLLGHGGSTWSAKVLP